jgi:beta-lactam-binding protein with PASTA domain
LLGTLLGALSACGEHERTTPVSTAALVPSLVGSPVDEAVRAVESAGLRAELVVGATPRPVLATDCPEGRVVAQDSAAGEELVRGSTVALTLTGCPLTPTP